MKKHLIIFAITALFILSGIALAGTSPSRATTSNKAPGPESNYSGKMQILEPDFDFGYTPMRTKVSHIFWLKNIGQDSLEIINIKPG